MKKLVTIDDLYALHSITSPKLAPNEEEAVFVRTQLHKMNNTYDAHLFHVDLQTEQVTQWTFGHEHVSSPAWCPTGHAVAFLRQHHDLQQVYVIQQSGGEARAVTSLPYGVTSFLWAPCGTKLYVTGTAVNGKLMTEQHEKALDQHAPYTVEGMNYKQDGASNDGLRAQRRVQHIAVIDMETGDVQQLTAGDFSYELQAINYAGTQLVYSVNRAENKDWHFESTMYVYTIETNEQYALNEREGSFYGAVFSFDDAYIAYVGADYTFKNATHAAAYVYDIEQKVTYPITEYIDAPVGDYIVTDHQQGVHAPAIAWTETNALYFQLSVMGDVRLYYATLDGAVYPASPEDEHIYDYAIMRSGNTALIAVTDRTCPGELFFYDITTGLRTQLTHFHDEWLAQVEIVDAQPIVYRSKDDRFDIHGWLMKPANFEEGKTYPLIVEIHGGPHRMYGNSFSHELQLLAAQGYAVLYTNPRGSHGYSQQFVDACRHDYGGGDYEDIMAGVDEVLQHTWINPNELAVTGDGYGGFMTNWIVGHTNRFKAAVTQHSISNWISFYGVSDIGYYFTPWQIGASMENVEKLWHHSPLNYARAIETPLLILHSEKNVRYPIEQAEQLYMTLKAQGKDVAFIRFPNSSHELSRDGMPSLREARLREMLQWFEMHLITVS